MVIRFSVENNVMIARIPNFLETHSAASKHIANISIRRISRFTYKLCAYDNSVFYVFKKSMCLKFNRLYQANNGTSLSPGWNSASV